MSSGNQLAALVEGGVEGDTVLPAAPDDPQPGPGQDADGVGVTTASLDGTLVDVSRPGVGHSAAVGEIHDRGPQLLVA